MTSLRQVKQTAAMRSRAPAQGAKTEKTATPRNALKHGLTAEGIELALRPASLAGMYRPTSAKHSRVKSSTTVRIRAAGHGQVCPTGNPGSSAGWAPAIKHRFARSAICALRYVTAPALPSWPDWLNNRSDRPDLREPVRRLRRAPIKRASGESIEYLRTELSSLSHPYCLKSFSNKEKAVSLPKIA